MAEELLGQDERENGPDSGDDNRDAPVEFSAMCQEFVSDLVSAIRAEDGNSRITFQRRAAHYLECLIMGGVSFVIDSLANPESRMWQVHYSIEGEPSSFAQPESEMVWATSIIEAREIGDKRAAKRTTMNRRVMVASVEEGHG